ncbi:MAG TPA: hypothetical protein VGH28_19530 [Polyangiaceae bacterium]|jgi:hypothetical protein
MSKGTSVKHTLSSLNKALGGATVDEVVALVEGHSKESLVAAGRTVATPRVSKDAARMYGEVYDWLATAKGDALDHVPLVDQDVLRVAVWAAAEDANRYRALTRSEKDQDQDVEASEAAESEAESQASAKRDQLHAALVAFAGGSQPLLAAVARAYGSVSALGDAIRDQTKLVRAWRTSGTAAVKARIKHAKRMTDGWLAGADKIANAWDAAHEAAGATRTRGPVSQADVDYFDGINLVVLELFVAWFEAGHAGDPSVPRLTYDALRTHVRRSHHAAPPPAVDPDATQPTPPVAPTQTA